MASSDRRPRTVFLWWTSTAARPVPRKRFACVQPKDTSQRFAGLHFGRDLLAAALGTPGRAHWKACEVGRSDEERLVAAFKAKVLGEGGS